MLDSTNTAALIGATVLDRDGDKIGTVGQVYVDPSSGAPLWASVKTGLFGTSESFVPLDDASSADGDLRVGYEKSFVKDAPRVDPDGALSEQETDELYAYYHRGGADHVDHDHADHDRTAHQGHDTAGHDTSGPNTDDAMTRSEEELHVGTTRVESGRARLHKYVVTENQSVTVPVSHEEVRLERIELDQDTDRGTDSGAHRN